MKKLITHFLITLLFLTLPLFIINKSPYGFTMELNNITPNVIVSADSNSSKQTYPLYYDPWVIAIGSGVAIGLIFFISKSFYAYFKRTKYDELTLKSIDDANSELAAIFRRAFIEENFPSQIFVFTNY